jgi:hypothetical protein
MTEELTLEEQIKAAQAQPGVAMVVEVYEHAAELRRLGEVLQGAHTEQVFTYTTGSTS